MSKRLEEKGLTLVLTDEAKEFLIEKGTSLEFGARPLRRAIEHYLEDPLAEELLRGTFDGKDTITVSAIKPAEAGAEARLVFEGSLTHPQKTPAAITAGAASGSSSSITTEPKR